LFESPYGLGAKRKLGPCGTPSQATILQSKTFLLLRCFGTNY
jgi:hypothetical protein